MKNGSNCIFVVGDSQFSGIPVPTHIICNNIAEEIGFKSSNLKAVRKRKTGAQRKKEGGFNLDFDLAEYILYLKK